MLQRIGSIGLGLHLGLVFLHNIGNIQLPSTCIKTTVDPIINSVQRLYTQDGLRHYAQLAGIHGCYGFYSPQVGSIYSSKIEVRCKQTATVLHLSHPGLVSTASKIRYCTLLEALRGWRPEDDQNRAPALARATAQSIHNYVQCQYPGHEIRLLIHSLHIPSLKEIRLKKQSIQTLIPIYEQAIQKNPPL